MHQFSPAQKGTMSKSYLYPGLAVAACLLTVEDSATLR